MLRVLRSLHRRIAERACSRTSRSATIPLLDKPFMRTDFSKRAFRFSAPTVWNLLPQTVLVSDSLSVFKSRLKTFLFNQAFTEHWSDLPPAPLKLRTYGAIEIRLLLLKELQNFASIKVLIVRKLDHLNTIIHWRFKICVRKVLIPKLGLLCTTSFAEHKACWRKSVNFYYNPELQTT